MNAVGVAESPVVWTSSRKHPPEVNFMKRKNSLKEKFRWFEFEVVPYFALPFGIVAFYLAAVIGP
nr:MAG TPA: hypothetical protein [Caudoviricetes sp.]